MHSCLITAPTITEYRSRAELVSDAVQAAALQPQLGVLGVAAVLEAAGDRPHLVDVNSAWLDFAVGTEPDTRDDFAEHLAAIAVRSNADLYGFSSICSTYPLSLRIAAAVKRLRPWATILFGGPQASVVDLPTMTAFPAVDLILRGEVEQTLPALLAELAGDYNLARVGGLTYRDGRDIKRTPGAPVIDDLDELPAPAYHLSTYLQRSAAASIELGRGCPFSCTFCSTNDFFRRKFRLRSPARVLSEMRAVATAFPIRHFELVHDMFTVDRKRVVAFCEAMLEAAEPFTWDCSARTDCVDEELLDLMARAGCRGVFFGIETGSRRMQRLIDKDLDPDRAEEILDIAERLGIRTTASLITGFPEENPDDLRDTLRLFMHSARCSGSRPQLNLLAPLAGTPIHAQHKHAMFLDELCSDMSHQGLTQEPLDLDLIRSFPEIFPNFYLVPTPWLDRDELFELREFLTASVTRFRWLLCAVGQATDLLAFHAGWRAWRATHRPGLLGGDLRLYYLGRRFHGDFIQYLDTTDLPDGPALRGLLRAEETLYLAEGNRTSSQIPPSGPHPPTAQAQSTDALSPSDRLSRTDVPRTLATTHTVELEHRLEDLIRSIGSCSAPPSSSPAFYATRTDARGSVILVEISPWMAATLLACDGRRDVAGVFLALAVQIPDFDEAGRDYVFGRMLLGAAEAGFLAFTASQT